MKIFIGPESIVFQSLGPFHLKWMKISVSGETNQTLHLLFLLQLTLDLAKLKIEKQLNHLLRWNGQNRCWNPLTSV